MEMNNSRELEMDAIVAEVKAQYDTIANQNRSEAEQWYNQRVCSKSYYLVKKTTQCGQIKIVLDVCSFFFKSVTTIVYFIPLVPGLAEQRGPGRRRPPYYQD